MLFFFGFVFFLLVAGPNCGAGGQGADGWKQAAFTLNGNGDAVDGVALAVGGISVKAMGCGYGVG